MRRLAAALLVVTVTVAGCTTLPASRGVTEGSPRAKLGRKMVVRKQEPRELIADDGSTCTTSTERFERVRPGQNAWCLWSPPA